MKFGSRRSGPTSVRVGGSLDDAVTRARDGDETGFLELWRAINPQLLRYLAVRGVEQGEDVAAETWLAVVRDLPRFIGDGDGFRAWVFTLARHRTIDAARMRASRPVVAMADVSVAAPSTTTPSAEDEALTNVSTERALALVASLPPEQAELVMLRVVADLDVAVVAKLVGKTPGAVRVAVHRALRQLSQDPRAHESQAPGEVI
jgi:RNA polymerase sigma-70 factor (ECF subfamily)